MPRLHSNCPVCGHKLDDYEYHLQACGECNWPEHEDEEEDMTQREIDNEYYEDNE